MDRSALSTALAASLTEFAWDEWAQMGVFSTARRSSPWAQDPEALILFTLEVGRNDARLFDEVLDWMLTNESLLSVRRLRALAADAEDQRLCTAALTWVGRHRPRARLQPAAAHAGGPTPLFHRGGAIRHPDPDFARAGYERSSLTPSHKSQPPNLSAPVNLAFRLRQILGVSARAEVIRLLLTIDAPRVTAAVLAQSAGYSKRNVHEALTVLTKAGVVDALTVGSEQRYAARADAWRGLLAPTTGRFPDYRDWPQLLGPLRRILRWLRNPDLDSLSDYMTSSKIRDLLEDLRRDLAYAGISLITSSDPQTAWQDLTDTTNLILSALMSPPLQATATEHRAVPT